MAALINFLRLSSGPWISMCRLTMGEGSNSRVRSPWGPTVTGFPVKGSTALSTICCILGVVGDGVWGSPPRSGVRLRVGEDPFCSTLAFFLGERKVSVGKPASLPVASVLVDSVLGLSFAGVRPRLLSLPSHPGRVVDVCMVILVFLCSKRLSGQPAAFHGPVVTNLLQLIREC